MQLIHLAHCVYQCEYQVVLVTKYRKEITNKELKQKFTFLRKVYWGTDGIWSEGYFALTMGIDEAVRRAYIEHQGKKDAG